MITQPSSSKKRASKTESANSSPAHQSFADLRKRLDILAVDIKGRVTHLEQLQTLLVPFHGPCAKLDVAQKLMALMGLEPKGGLLPDPAVQKRMKQNKRRLDNPSAVANKHMLYESPVPKIAAERKAVLSSARQLLTDLEFLVSHLKVIRKTSSLRPKVSIAESPKRSPRRTPCFSTHR